MILGVIATLIGASAMAALRIIERKTMALRSSDRKIADSVMAFWRSFGVVPVALLFWLIVDGGSLKVQSGFWLAVALTGILNIFILIFTLRALADKNTDATLSVPVMDTTPAAIVFLSWWILGQRPSNVGYFGIALLVLGAYTLNISAFVDKFHSGKWSLVTYFAPFAELSRKIGVRWAFAAAVLGCIAINFDGKAATSASPFLGLALVVTPSLVVNFLRAWKAKALKQLLDSRRMNFFLRWCYPTTWGMILCLYWWSLANLIVPYQATLKRIETLVLFLLAYCFLYERKNAKIRFAATLIIVVGAILVTFSVA